jgi:hypothetical protein
MNQMNDDQQLFWDVISCNYSRISHAWGQEMLDLVKRNKMKKFHNMANGCVSATLSWPTDARSRAVKTWLSIYRLPFDPRHMESFDAFHKTTSSYILNNGKHIHSYDENLTT